VAHLSPKQAAQALGVSESSIKRWCDQGTVPVVKTAGGHRRIPSQSVDQIIARGGNLRGNLDPVAIVDAVAGTTFTNAGLGLDGVSVSSGAAIALDECRREFLMALQQGHEGRCRQLITSLLRSGHSRSSAADLLISDSMYHFGHLWEQGDLAVYQERRACGICLGLLHELKQSSPPPLGGPVAIGGTTTNDTYQLATQMVELSLIDIGWQATSLGCNLPIETFRSAVQEYRPRLLWFSLSVIASEEEFVRDFNELADAIGDSTTIVVGGRAATDALRPRLRYTAHCDSLSHLAELAHRLAGPQTNLNKA